MRERVELLGGEYRLDSAPGEGTRILATLSLDEPLASGKDGQ
jgi:signal transduction histidine kinase